MFELNIGDLLCYHLSVFWRILYLLFLTFALVIKFDWTLVLCMINSAGKQVLIYLNNICVIMGFM